MLLGIEQTSYDKIRIGPETFRLVHCQHPLPDGTTMGVEVAGRPYCGYQQIFDVEYLKGIPAYQLPKGLYIAIYAPRLSVKQIDHIEIANPYGSPALSLLLSYGYGEWDGESNLNHFGSTFAGKLLHALPHCVSAKAEPQDSALGISVRLDIPKTADLYDFLHQIDIAIADLLQESVKPRSIHTNPPTLKPDEHGYKWWLRYIVIPVLGSALVVAVLKWVFWRQT